MWMLVPYSNDLQVRRRRRKRKRKRGRKGGRERRKIKTFNDVKKK